MQQSRQKIAELRSTIELLPVDAKNNLLFRIVETLYPVELYENDVSVWSSDELEQLDDLLNIHDLKPRITNE